MINRKNFYSSQQLILVAGVDESGCGSLAGSVVASAVILHSKKIQLISGLTDSKIISKKKRADLYQNIIRYALAWSVGFSSSEEIDCLNILQARLLAMQRAIFNLSISPDLILIDGDRAPRLKNIPYRCLVKGDLTVPIISAASIVAKVTRDQNMFLLDSQYPKYNFAHNKGYPTKFHLKQLNLYGPILCHRKSFAPIKYMIKKFK